MGSLSGATSLKKNDSSFPSIHQLTVTSQIEVGFLTAPHPCWDLGWLVLMQISCMWSQSLEINICNEPAMSGKFSWCSCVLLLALVIFLHPISWWSLNPGVTYTSHLELKVLTFLLAAYWAAVVLCMNYYFKWNFSKKIKCILYIIYNIYIIYIWT